MSSFTEEQTLITNGYSFFPAKFSTYAYGICLKSAAVVRGYGISFLVTLIGTICNLLFTTLGYYPLSRKGAAGPEYICLLSVLHHAVFRRPGTLFT